MKLFWIPFLVLMLVLSASAGGARKKKSSKKTTSASSSKTSAGKKATSAKARKSASRRPAVTWRNRQMQPTPARYKEIQQALADKGYLSSENVNGAWGDASMDALKRFQADQKIESTGKINSLSIIALGLGPKRETATATPPPQPDPAR